VLVTVLDVILELVAFQTPTHGKATLRPPKTAPNNLHSRGRDGRQQVARAVGGPDGQRRETLPGTGNLTVAVVASAGTLLHRTRESEAHEREDDGNLHFGGGRGLSDFL